METIEYRVRPVSRYVVTRFVASGNGNKGAVGSSLVGEFPNRQLAEDVAYAFAGKHATVSGNILPGDDSGSLLRNIAEDVDAKPVKRGLVILERNGAVEVYGLGAKVGEAEELLDAARVHLDALSEHGPQ